MVDPNHPKEKDPLSGVETTGHEWDGLKELNTPLPKWWFWTYVATCVWGAAFCVVYPSWPSLHGYFKGKQALYEYQAEQARQDTRIAKAREIVTTEVVTRYVKVAGETKVSYTPGGNDWVVWYRRE